MSRHNFQRKNGVFDFTAFLRVRRMVLRVKDGESPIITGDEEELLTLPKDWPLPPPDGLLHEFQNCSQEIIDRAIAAGTFGFDLETVVQIVHSTETVRDAAIMAAGMRVLMGDNANVPT